MLGKAKVKVVSEDDDDEEDDEDDYTGSLTTRLAETAVGVREMSKQLGEHCSKSHLLSLVNRLCSRTCSRAV